MKKYMKLGLALFFVFVLLICCVPVDVNTDVVSSENLLVVHFIDVGQGDATLIKTPDGENILIDAGDNSHTDEMIAYLQKQGIQSFTAVIGTHPHEDHIGGLDKVIDKFEIENVYMPKVVHTTKTFEDVLDSIDRKGLKIKSAASGIKIPLKNVDAVFLAPVSDKYEELNNYSGVLRLQYGDNVFLFTGDAEALSEEEMLAAHPSELFRAQVLKVGHHGSKSSTSEAFLSAVLPEYGIISTGEDNSYKHPHEETLDILQQYGVSVLRTDIQGTIIIKSNGEKIEVIKGAGQ